MNKLSTLSALATALIPFANSTPDNYQQYRGKGLPSTVDCRKPKKYRTKRLTGKQRKQARL